MKAAIYARFSSELQSARSIDDQVALCRAFAARTDLEVSAVFEDRARSGASTIGREGLASLMEAARSGNFKVVVVEALDRLSRDQEDLAGIWKRLRFLGVEIRAVHDGRADAVQIGVRGLIGAIYLEDLAHKVRRGLAGVVRDGRHAGGKAYGYQPVPGKPGELSVVPEQAAIVRRIFAEFLAGLTPREIAGRLNREGLPPPRGSRWNASTINGSRQRGNGILHNDLYIGRLVWNRLRMVKDPDTGKRVSRLNPESDWQVAEATHLAIVDKADFDKVAARKRKIVSEAGNRQRPRHLLSGLLRCGACGGGMSVHDRDSTGKVRVRCSRRRESGDCDHSRIYYLDGIERTAVEALRDELRDPDLLAEYVAAYQEERRRVARDRDAEVSRLNRRLGETRRSIDRLVDALAEGRQGMKSVAERLDALEAERVDLEKAIAANPEINVVTLHPAAIDRYLGQMEILADAVRARPRSVGDSAAGAFRELVEAVVVHPVPPRAELDIEIAGNIRLLLGQPTRDKGPPYRLRARRPA